MVLGLTTGRVLAPELDDDPGPPAGASRIPPGDGGLTPPRAGIDAPLPGIGVPRPAIERGAPPLPPPAAGDMRTAAAG